jgi:hypothetical protein
MMYSRSQALVREVRRKGRSCTEPSRTDEMLGEHNREGHGLSDESSDFLPCEASVGRKVGARGSQLKERENEETPNPMLLQSFARYEGILP